MRLAGWFGRNLDAWWDTIQTGAIAPALDEHSTLIFYVGGPRFWPGSDGHAFIEVTNECD
jgi:Barstar (barnase inhibitor)